MRSARAQDGPQIERQRHHHSRQVCEQEHISCDGFFNLNLTAHECAHLTAHCADLSMLDTDTTHRFPAQEDRLGIIFWYVFIRLF